MKRITLISIIIIVAILSFFFFYNSSEKEDDQIISSQDSTALKEAVIADSMKALSKVSDMKKDTVSETIKPDKKEETTKKNTTIDSTTKTAKTEKPLWPVKKPPLLSDALLPSHRIITFYGNLYSKRMGILGEYPPDTVLKRLQARVKQWQKADSSTKAIPALQLIAMSAQLAPGRDSFYRMKMPSWMIDSVIHMARSINGITILDYQVGKSTVQNEVPYYEKYLKMPDVHLAIDPEFYMQRGNRPGTHIGTMDAKDINYCINYLAKLVKEYELPPKLLVIHRFTQAMITNYKDINLKSQVQVIIDMDGFGAQHLKKDSYRRYIYNEPIEYTGIKLFLKNDNAKGHKILSPKQVLGLTPEPVYIQYQ